MTFKVAHLQEVTEQRNWPFPLPKKKTYTYTTIRTFVKEDLIALGLTDKEVKEWLSSYTSGRNQAFNSLPEHIDLYIDTYSFNYNKQAEVIEVTYEITIIPDRKTAKRVYLFTFNKTHPKRR